jgi:hypothetical protein
VIGIGYEKSEQLDVKPAEYFVLVTMRDKRGRPVSNSTLSDLSSRG